MLTSPLQQMEAPLALLLRESQSFAHSAQLDRVLEMCSAFGQSAQLNVNNTPCIAKGAQRLNAMFQALTVQLLP